MLIQFFIVVYLRYSLKDTCHLRLHINGVRFILEPYNTYYQNKINQNFQVRIGTSYLSKYTM